jgi:translation initiation factor IF-1
MSEQQQKEKMNGVVIEALPDTTFKVKLENDTEILAYLAGKMRMNYIKVMIGDRVTVEVSPDGSRGRIVFRN